MGQTLCQLTMGSFIQQYMVMGRVEVRPSLIYIVAMDVSEHMILRKKVPTTSTMHEEIQELPLVLYFFPNGSVERKTNVSSRVIKYDVGWMGMGNRSIRENAKSTQQPECYWIMLRTLKNNIFKHRKSQTCSQLVNSIFHKQKQILPRLKTSARPWVRLHVVDIRRHIGQAWMGKKP